MLFSFSNIAAILKISNEAKDENEGCVKSARCPLACHFFLGNSMNKLTGDENALLRVRCFLKRLTSPLLFLTGNGI